MTGLCDIKTEAAIASCATSVLSYIGANCPGIPSPNAESITNLCVEQVSSFSSASGADMQAAITAAVASIGRSLCGPPASQQPEAEKVTEPYIRPEPRTSCSHANAGDLALIGAGVVVARVPWKVIMSRLLQRGFSSAAIEVEVFLFLLETGLQSHSGLPKSETM